MRIEIHTQSLTADSLDHDQTIPEDRIDEAIDIYIDMALAAIRAAYPAADVSTARGNGLTSHAAQDDEGCDDYDLYQEAGAILDGVYEGWCATIEQKLGVA